MKVKYLLFLAALFTLNGRAQNTNREAVMNEAYQKLWTPAIRAKIDEGIERNRKGEATLEFLDRDGRPVKDVSVSIRQESHEFLFGCNLFVLGQLRTPELNTKYEEAFTRLFNFATIPFYWRDLEPEEGRLRFAEGSKPIWRRPSPDVLLKWCLANHITPKGHCLMYAKSMFMPEWTAKDDPGKLIKQSEKHIHGIAERYKDDIFIWDVANEEIGRSRHPEEWHKVPEDYLSWCFRRASLEFTDKTMLIYNDGSEAFTYTNDYISIFKKLLAQGAEVGGMGIQMHAYDREAMLKGKLYPPAAQLEAFDKMGELNLPIYMTEITIPGREEDGPELQAEIVENLYRLWFSIPQMAGITWWNLGDSTAFGNENKAMGGLLDSNMNPKPAYEALDRLINHEWKTDLEITGNSQGNVSFRGFYGKYKITASHNGKLIEREINLSKGGRNKFTIQL